MTTALANFHRVIVFSLGNFGFSAIAKLYNNGSTRYTRNLPCGRSGQYLSMFYYGAVKRPQMNISFVDIRKRKRPRMFSRARE